MKHLISNVEDGFGMRAGASRRRGCIAPASSTVLFLEREKRRELAAARARLACFCDMSRAEQIYRLRKMVSDLRLNPPSETDGLMLSDGLKYIAELSLKDFRTA